MLGVALENTASMQIAIENIAKFARKMTIAMPAEVITDEVDKQLHQTAQKARLKGFRPGHVPILEIKRRFGEQIQQEATSKIMMDSFLKAVSEKSLRLATVPVFKPAAQEDAAGLFTFDALFEVLLEVEVGDLSTLKLTKHTATVTDADLDAAIENMLKSRQRFRKIEDADRAAEEGDRIILDWSPSTIEGEAPSIDAQPRQDVPVVLDSKLLPVEMFEQLIGAKPGEERVLEFATRRVEPAETAGAADATTPSDTTIGEPDKVKCTIKAIEVPEALVLDDNMLAAFGVTEGGEEQFRQNVKASMESRLKNAVWQRFKAQAFQALTDLHKNLEVSKTLIQNEVKRLEENAQKQEQPGMQQAASSAATTSLDRFHAPAANNVRLQLVMEQLAREHDVQAGKDEVRKRLEEMTHSYTEPEQVIRWYYSDPTRLAPIQNAVLEDKIVQKVLELASVTEQSSSYDEIVHGPQQVDKVDARP